MMKYFHIAAIMTLYLTTTISHAQTLEPRAYSNAPPGLNFLVAGYQNSSGALLFDPAVPITDASASIDVGLIGYLRTLDIAGKSAKVGVILPYASLSARGTVAEDFRKRDTQGTADPTFYFSINFYGAPALSLKEFQKYQQKTIIGFTFKLTAPLGAYDSEKLINISSNRWTFEPGIGLSHAVRNWRLEASAAAAFYTDNNDFFNGNKREQEPVYSTQVHITYNFPLGIWAAVSTTYYAGGRSTVAGVLNNDLQQNWRTGLTLALPVNRHHSIKLYGSSGVSARTGSNYDLLGIAWQYRWGAGL